MLPSGRPAQGSTPRRSRKRIVSTFTPPALAKAPMVGASGLLSIPLDRVLYYGSNVTPFRHWLHPWKEHLGRKSSCLKREPSAARSSPAARRDPPLDLLSRPAGTDHAWFQCRLDRHPDFVGAALVALFFAYRRNLRPRHGTYTGRTLCISAAQVCLQGPVDGRPCGGRTLRSSTIHYHSPSACHP